jgi:hypothetical protein
MKSAKCENCGAGAIPGAVACAYCGTTFVTAAPDPLTGWRSYSELQEDVPAGSQQL